MPAQATLRGNITDAGGTDITTRGFAWNTTTHTDPGNTSPSNSAYDSDWTESGTFGTGTYTTTIDTLSVDEVYYYRAAAENSVGWSYGSEVTFTTPTTGTTFTKLISDTGVISSIRKMNNHSKRSELTNIFDSRANEVYITVEDNHSSADEPAILLSKFLSQITELNDIKRFLAGELFSKNLIDSINFPKEHLFIDFRRTSPADKKTHFDFKYLKVLKTIESLEYLSDIKNFISEAVITKTLHDELGLLDKRSYKMVRSISDLLNIIDRKFNLNIFSMRNTISINDLLILGLYRYLPTQVIKRNRTYSLFIYLGLVNTHSLVDSSSIHNFLSFSELLELQSTKTFESIAEVFTKSFSDLIDMKDIQVRRNVITKLSLRHLYSKRQLSISFSEVNKIIRTDVYFKKAFQLFIQTIKESSVLLDSLTFSLKEVRSDVFDNSSILSFSLSKFIKDILYRNEIVVFSLIKSLVEQFDIKEIVEPILGKSLLDAISLTDTRRSFYALKVLSIININDTRNIFMETSYMDTIERTSEYKYKVFQLYIESFKDIIDLNESYTYVVSKRSEDIMDLSHIYSYKISLGLSDVLDKRLDKSFLLSKNVSDISTLLDARTIEIFEVIRKILTETLELHDEKLIVGLISVNDVIGLGESKALYIDMGTLSESISVTGRYKFKLLHITKDVISSSGIQRITQALYARSISDVLMSKDRIIRRSSLSKFSTILLSDRKLFSFPVYNITLRETIHFSSLRKGGVIGPLSIIPSYNTSTIQFTNKTNTVSLTYKTISITLAKKMNSISFVKRMNKILPSTSKD